MASEYTVSCSICLKDFTGYSQAHAEIMFKAHMTRVHPDVAEDDS